MTSAPSFGLVAAAGLRFIVRPGTTDLKVVAEVVERQVYRRAEFLDAEPGDRWLDLGGNIGTFACWAGAKGAEVASYEPEPENFGLLVRNVEQNGLGGAVTCHRAAVVAGAPGRRLLYLCNGVANKYRHTLTPVRGRRALAVDCLGLGGLLDGWPNAVKLDIEGSELPMLTGAHGWPGIRKLVFEYHLDRDRSLARFAARMAALRAAGFEVRHPKMPADKAFCDWWPAAALVHARRG